MKTDRIAVASSRYVRVLLLAAVILGGGRTEAAPSSLRQPPPEAEPETSAPPGGHSVVVELFTSQGCSSCPPADRLLAELGEQGSGRVVPLAFHVDFWNHIGWTDPFSSHAWTERQLAYARVLGVRQVYTPQAVVDGGAELVGSEAERLRAAIAAAAARSAAEVSLALEPAQTRVRVSVEVELPEALRGRKWDLWLAVFETGLVTSVGRGENGGRTLRDDYVVRSLRRGGRLGGGGPLRTQHTAELSLDQDWKRSQLGVAAFVQDSGSLEIRGANSRFLPRREGS